MACLLTFSPVLFVVGDTNESFQNPITSAANFDQSAQKMCLLDGLTFTNGLKLIGKFSPDKFAYECSCDNFADGGEGFSTQVAATLMDTDSSAEITFNGERMHFRQPTQNVISNDQAGDNSPLTISAPMILKHGEYNTITIGVSRNGRSLPDSCYYEYKIRCALPETSYVIGDPQFVGLRGQRYQVHGISGEVLNIVSDRDLQYNSRFLFLDKGECPIVDGTRQKGCFSHPGSYLGELGIKTRWW